LRAEPGRAKGRGEARQRSVGSVDEGRRRSSGGRHYGAHRCPRLIDSSHFLRKTSVYNIFEIFEIFLFFEFFSYF